MTERQQAIALSLLSFSTLCGADLVVWHGQTVWCDVRFAVKCKLEEMGFIEAPHASAGEFEQMGISLLCQWNHGSANQRNCRAVLIARRIEAHVELKC